MGKSSSVPAFLDKIDQATSAIADTKPGLIAAGKTGKTILTASGAAAGVGRGVGHSKVARGINAYYDLKGTGQTAKVVVGYRGAAQLVNNPTKPHEIRRKKRRKGRGGIVIPGVGVRVSANHPGTRGKRFYQAGKVRADVECPKAYMRAGVSAPLKAVFK